MNIIERREKIAVVQANLQKGLAATSEMNKWLEKAEIALIQEPYSVKGKVASLSRRLQVIQAEAERPLATVVVSNSNIDILFHKDISNHKCVCCEIIVFGQRIIIVSIYRPFGEEMANTYNSIERIMQKFTGQAIIIGGDFNVHSPVWEDPLQDTEADEFLDFLAVHELHVVNDPASPPTFVRPRGQSWIDV
ncbi:uncharacterized protein LOC111615478 [Centruroides sculpturatus]|uniref:uncharacterized protein LOC111615478 n=1 Tax=Centruroides sculpturatus TaxID=218467 RepID=UPI000C6E196C|nr:uncharacterized protein LOC111615478 [Centruroides sculpturatus]